MGDSEFQKPVTGTFTAAAQTVDLGTPNTGTEVVQVTGTWSATLIVEGCNDNATWQPFFLLNSSTFAISNSITANGIYLIPTNGFNYIRIRCSAYTSGTAIITEYGSDQVTITQGVDFIRGGTDGTVIGNNGNKLLTDGSGVTQPISAASLPLPTGAATEATLVKLALAQGAALGSDSGPLVQGSVTTAAPTYVSGTVNPLSMTTAGALRTDASATTQPISAASLPLPTGAATSANQTAEATLIGPVTETAPATDTASSGLNGRLQRIAQRITSLIALVPASLGQKASASSFAVTLSTEQEAEIGIVTETAPATDTASSGLNGRLQRIAQRLTSMIAVLPSTISVPWFERITDGTNTAAVKAASTAPAAADPALVVTLSPNSAQIVISPLPASGSKFSFGRVTTTSTSTSPVEETTYTEQTTNGQRSLASSNAGDTSAGTGARTVLITYYDQTGAGPFTESVSMNGTATANTVGTNICYIESLKVTSVGSSAANLGTITLFTAINKGGTTITTIAVGDSQTFHAHHYVPTGKTCYISGFSVGNNSASAGAGGLFVLKASTPTVANSQELQVSDFVTIAGAVSTDTRPYNSPIQVTGPARVRAYVTPYATSTVTHYASFDFIDN